MKNHDKNSHSDPLESNLSKLICKDNLLPVPDEETKAAMLERLREKQAILSAPSVKKSQRLWFSPLVCGGIAAAAVLLLGVMFFDLPSSSGVSTVGPILADSKNVGSDPKDPVLPIVIPEVIAYEATAQTRRIELRDGSTAIAERGTRFIEVAPRQLKLEVGSLYLLVAKAATPLEVVTPQGKALALGTRFLVSSKKTDTRVAVAQGRVQLARADDKKLVLARGEEGVLAPSELTRRPAPRLSHLVSWARDSLRQAEDVGLEKVPRRGVIAIDPQGQESRLSLREYSLDVLIENGVARTTIDQTFFNHYHSNTEGTFYFPLPPGAAVSRLAMYVNGVRNEGCMVERNRGQQIYNDIKYANRDPALLEQLEGNLYKLRIFPLEGRQEKRIFLSFTQNVDELYRTLRYWFPMGHTQDNAGVVKIKVRIKNGEELFDADSSTHEFIKTFDDGDLVLSYEAADIKPEQDLLLKLIPKFEQKEIAESATLKRGDKSYLHTRIRPVLEGQIDPQPRQWFVLNDTSASRSAADLKAQAHIVERLLAEADDKDLIAIANLNINVERLMREPVSLRDEMAKQAVEKMSTARRIGGTNLAAGITAMRDWIVDSGATNPHLIYLGDGLATDGAVTSRALTALLDKEVPFLGIAVGKKADLSLLRDAANATGGEAYLMNPDEDLNWRVFDMLASMNTPRLTGLTWEFLGAPGQIKAYGDRTTLAAGEVLSLVAKIDQKLPILVILRGEFEGERWEKMVRLEPTREDATFIPRFWAKMHLKELLKDGELNREEIVRLSKKHYVATPFTSLIVLENDKMYQDYEVEKGRNDHWAAYPAPDKIPVVREPMPWHTRSWSQAPNVPFDDSKILIDPKTAEEILETLLPPARPQSGNATSIDQVRRYLYKGEGFYDLGLYDKAEDEFHQVLRIDPYNKAARRWLERCASIKSDYFRAAYDENRARLLMKVDSAWELAVPTIKMRRDLHSTWSNNRDGRSPVESGGGAVSGRDIKRNWRSDYLMAPEDTTFRFANDGWKVPAQMTLRGGNGRGSDYRGRPVYYPFVGDLTTVIPALATSASDRASAVEMKLGRERLGSITDEAAALVRASEAKRKPIRFNGSIITPDGRVKGSSSSAMYLEEETISDGKNWFHIYRELGFATLRPVTPTNLALIQSSVPHWPPSFRELEARWTVTLAARHDDSFELVLVDPEDASLKHVMKISTDGRLLQVSQWNGEELTTSRNFGYEGQTVVITNDLGDIRRYEAVEVEVAEALFAPDLEGLVVLDLPLRRPAFYEKQFGGVAKGELEIKKLLLRHFILSKLFDHRVVAVPGSKASKSIPLTAKSAWTQLIQLGAGSTPVFDHRTLAAAINIRSAFPEGSDFLAHFKEVAILSGCDSLSPAQVEAFVEDWPESPYLLDVVQRCYNLRAWIPLLDLPIYRAMAVVRIASVSGKEAWPDRAVLASRIADFLMVDAQAGSPSVVSKSLAHFLGREQQENGNWERLVDSYREIGKDLTLLDSSGVAALLDLAIKERDQELERRCLDQLQESMVKPEESAILADIFGSHGRHEKAVGLYQKALAGIENPDSFLLQKASLSAKQVDENLSITWQHQALRKLSQSERSANKVILSQHYSELLGRALAVGELGAAMELALEGYELLPDQHLLVTTLASHFHKLGQETERWRWLSTIIDRNPKNAEASGAIGGWYENEALLMKADEMYAEAHSCDSAHPQWLVRRASTLYRAGRYEEADAICRELRKTTWAHQLKSQVPAVFRLYLSDPGKIGLVTREDPGEGWADPDFDDRAWKERVTRFTSNDSDLSLWSTTFYTRQKFQVARIPRKIDLQAGVHGVECEVYLNGFLVQRLKEKGASSRGSDTPYTVTLSQEILDALQIGENVLAVRYKKVGKKPRAYVELMQLFALPKE
jgi:tetratricopeptide (TPR) repeat protein